MRAVVGALLASLGVACSSGTTKSGDAWPLGVDAGADVVDTEEAACRRDDDCPGESHCFYPKECGSVPRCEPGYSSCSAAPPFLGCGCDGQVEWLSAGCPGSYAWDVGNLAYDADGQACDAAAETPFEYHITVRITDDPVFAEGDLWAKLSYSALTSATVRVDETRVVMFEGTGDQWVSFTVDLLVDRDGDGECTPEVDENFATVEESTDVDLETFEVTSNVYKNRVSVPCDRWR